MKKLLSILTLLVVAVTGAWAQTTNPGTYSTQVISADGKTSTWTFILPSSQVSVPTGETIDNDIVYAPSGSNKMKFSSSNQFSWSGKSSGYIYVPAGSAGTISMTVKSSSDTRFLQLYVDGVNAGESYRLYSKLNADGITADGKKGPQSFDFTATDLTTKDGKTYLHFKDNDTEMKIATFTITLTSGAYGVPSLTGAWKIGEEVVTDAELVQGSAATVPTFTVGATSGTPEADDYTVAYSLKEGSTAGIFTFTETGGITAISTATAGTATIVATLSSKNIEDFLDADPNTFEYTVTVAAASAPTEVTVTPSATSVERGGDAITLTAEVTGGVPTPTLQWYSNTTASNESGTIIDGATEETYQPAIDAVGTFYYYVVATNASGSAKSAAQTITVVPKAPTMTASGYFDGTKVVEIAKAEGEAAAAEIKYSTNNGESWSDYTAALNVTETTTVKAKVVQAGLESDVVSATYTKFVKSELAAVSNNIKWNFNDDVFNTERSVTETSSPALDEELTYADFAIIKDFELPASFDGTSLSYVGSTAAETAYPTRNKATQAVNLHIKTTVPGTLTVTFSDTGSSVSASAHKRYLNINGTNTEFYTSRPTSGSTKSNDKKTVTTDVIPAGDIWIKAMKEDGTSETMVCFYDIEFNPAIEVTSAGWATTVTPDYAVDFADGVQAYIVESVGEAITLKEIDDAPANTPIIVNASKGSYTMTKKATATSDVNGNKLEAATGAETGDGTGNYYVLGMTNKGVGFGKLANGVKLAKGKAYIDGNEFVDAKDFYPFVIGDEENETTSINSIENGESRIENYDYFNLSGQRVGKDYKGIVIVNGKKVIRK